MSSERTKRPVKSLLEDLPFYLARAALSFRRVNDRTLREVGLKPQAPGVGSVLYALLEEDNCPVNSLVVRTHLPNGTLSGVLDRLEQQQIIKRAENSQDGRSWQISLTAKGKRLRQKLMKRHEIVLRIMNGSLSPSEQAELRRLLAVLTEAMRAYASPAGHPKY